MQHFWWYFQINSISQLHLEAKVLHKLKIYQHLTEDLKRRLFSKVGVQPRFYYFQSRATLSFQSSSFSWQDNWEQTFVSCLAAGSTVCLAANSFHWPPWDGDHQPQPLTVILVMSPWQCLAPEGQIGATAPGTLGVSSPKNLRHFFILSLSWKTYCLCTWYEHMHIKAALNTKNSK